MAWDHRKLKEADEAEEAWRRFVRAVEWFGERQPNAKRAIAVLRRNRTGEVRAADAQELAHRIAVMIIEYCKTHQHDDNLFISRTLNAVPGALEEIVLSQKRT